MSPTVAKIVFFGGLVLLLLLCAALRIWYGGYRMRNDDAPDSALERELIADATGRERDETPPDHFNRWPPA